MSAIVFDSSVLIAILRQEPGSEVGEQSLNEVLISTVNLAEVATYLARNSVPTETINQALAAFPIEVIEVVPSYASNEPHLNFLKG